MSASGRIAAARIAIGFAQGLALYGLTDAASRRVWPATTPPLFGALVLAIVFAPLIVIGGVGRIRPRWLAAWTLAAAIALALIGWHDLDVGVWSGSPTTPPRLGLASQVFLFSAVFVFVGHHLVGPADEARRWLAPYPAYFDWAWKDGVQVVLSLAFVGILWLALELGGALFKLIGIPALADMLEQHWFDIPVTTTAFAAAVQLTDVQVVLIRGVRIVGLVLLAWLLPVMTAIVLAFLAALPLTGLASLFGTRAGASTVLSAAAVLIVLTSAAYGNGEARPPIVLRYAARAAGLALVPLVLIAADAIWLRLRQYGLTPDRIAAIACWIAGAGFALGYALAAVRRSGPWLKPLERANIAMAHVVMLVILALFTPIADPARLAVNDQVGRLLAGRTTPSAFDFQFLYYRSGRYGRDALARLAALKGGALEAQIADLATRATKNEGSTAPPPPTFAERLKVFPLGATLPASFIGQDWSQASPTNQDDIRTSTIFGACLHGASNCDAYALNVEGDARPEVLLGLPSDPDTLKLAVFRQGEDGRWTDVGSLTVRCRDSIAALRVGQLSFAPRTGKELVLAGRRQPMTPAEAQVCPGERAP
jgi:hypothetical protein